jgi:exodeoxyribonuclease VII large subunit
MALRLSPTLLSRAQAQRRERLAAGAGRLNAALAATFRNTRRDLDRNAARLDIACVERIATRWRERLAQAARLLHSYSYEAVLERGFALVLDAAGRTVRTPAQVAAGDALAIRLAEGEIGATVTGERRARRGEKRSGTSLGQGSLF